MNRMAYSLARLRNERDGCVMMANTHLVTSSSEEIVTAFSKMAEMFDNVIDVFDLMKTTVDLSEEFVEDVLPQAAKLTIQRFDNLNELCMNITKLNAPVRIEEEEEDVQ